jgi:tRNA(Ile)-lysidine synthase
MNPQHTFADAITGRFLSHAETEGLWPDPEPVLVAVSGGVDSVVLTHLVVRTGKPFAIAHCNFNLRGEESARDEAFTVALAQQLGVEIHTEHFNTYEYAFKEGISTEMAARDLRYAWFAHLVRKQGYQCVATGHHADDQIETLLLNLIRGTGISGLRGMLPKAGQVVRPLLNFFRSEIVAFAKTKNLQWIEDSSNASTEIRRNRIRHEIMPVIEKCNPNYRQTILRTIEHIKETEIIYRNHLAETFADIVVEEPGGVHVSIDGMKRLSPLSTYLYELLANYGFNSATTDAVAKAMNGIPGKQFLSPSHRLVKDRDHLIITVRPSSEGEEEWEYFIADGQEMVKTPVRIFCRVIPADQYTVNPVPTIAALDYHKLSFPLTIRRWRTGDAFVPLGMRNKKKLSDLFSDLKLSLPEKEQVWVITSGEEIVWVAGHRLSNNFRITTRTRQVFEMNLMG